MKSSAKLQSQVATNALHQQLMAQASDHTQTMESLIVELNEAVEKAKKSKDAVEAEKLQITALKPGDSNKAALDAQLIALKNQMDADQKVVDTLNPKVIEARRKAKAYQEGADKLAAKPVQDAFAALLSALTNLNTWIWGCLIGGVGYMIYSSVHSNESVGLLQALSDHASARGMITVMVLSTALALAIMIVYQAYLVGTTNENFRMAREIFGSLIGIVGTIIGFYFGTINEKADPNSPKVSLGQPDIQTKQEGEFLQITVRDVEEPFKILIKDAIKPDEKELTSEVDGKVGANEVRLAPNMKNKELLVQIKKGVETRGNYKVKTNP